MQMLLRGHCRLPSRLPLWLPLRLPLPLLSPLCLPLCLLTLCALALPAAAMDCPAPPVQSRKDWDVQVRAEVGRIGLVRGAQLDTQVRSVTQDLLGKLPGADRVYLEQMMFSAYCSALRDDPRIDGAEKSRQILDYRRALGAALGAAGGAGNGAGSGAGSNAPPKPAKPAPH